MIQRPKSSPAARQPEVKLDNATPAKSASSLSHCRPSSFDHLTPDLSYELSDGAKVESFYGDKPETPQSEAEEKEDTVDGEDEETEEERGPDVGISKVDSKLKEKLQQAQERVMKISVPAVEAKGPYALHNLSEEDSWAAQINELDLRPEHLDLLHIPELPDHDVRRFDFEARDTPFPVNEFPFPFSESMQRVDFREIYQLSTKAGTSSWKEHTDQRPDSEHEEEILNRIYEMAKLCVQSQEADQSKKEKTSQNKQMSRSRLGARMITTRSWKDKKCCSDCMQSLCTGNCPSKRMFGSEPCRVCHEHDCAGQCTKAVYDIRSRKDKEEEITASKPIVPHAKCTSCQYRYQLKLLQAKHGVQRSAGGNRPQPNESAEKTDNAEGMYNVPSAAVQRRKSGRASIYPHKGYFSQRRMSLTGKDSTREKLRIALKGARLSVQTVHLTTKDKVFRP